MEWNSLKKNTQFIDKTDSERTLTLAKAINDADIISTVLNSCGKDVIKYGRFSNNIDDIIDHAVKILQKYPKMLQYKFKNDDNTLQEIEVHTHIDKLYQNSANQQEICKNACMVHAAIQLFINSRDSTQKPDVTLTQNLSDKCHYGAIDGGSKSKHRRRRHSRRNLRVKTYKRRRN